MRPFLRLPRALLAPFIALSLLMPAACSAGSSDSTQYVEGTHYKKVREASPPSANKRIKVEEFFWYGCPHCFAFEPVLQKWVKTKPADVDFIQVPNSLGRPVGMLHSRVFYAEDSLGLLAKTHTAFFNAIHEGRQTMETDQEIAAFFSQASGIMPDVFIGTLNGFAVDSRSRSAEELAKQYGIASTPMVVVDGKYIIDARAAGGFDGMIKIMDFLINKARSDRKK